MTDITILPSIFDKLDQDMLNEINKHSTYFVDSPDRWVKDMHKIAKDIRERMLHISLAATAILQFPSIFPWVPVFDHNSLIHLWWSMHNINSTYFWIPIDHETFETCWRRYWDFVLRGYGEFVEEYERTVLSCVELLVNSTEPIEYNDFWNDFVCEILGHGAGFRAFLEASFENWMCPNRQLRAYNNDKIPLLFWLEPHVNSTNVMMRCVKDFEPMHATQGFTWANRLLAKTDLVFNYQFDLDDVGFPFSDMENLIFDFSLYWYSRTVPEDLTTLNIIPFGHVIPVVDLTDIED